MIQISFLPERGGLFPGYLLIQIKGRGIARLMNLTVKEGIRFRDLRSLGDTITVKIAPGDFKKLRPLLRKTGCTVHILEKKGGLLLSLAGRHRRGFLLGLILFCFILYFLSSLIWNISITGNETVSRSEILGVLEKHGVVQGILKKQLDLARIERAILLEIEELSWVGARVRGVYLEIQVVERLMEPPVSQDVVDLVAAKDGLVVDVLVLAGEAAVNPGETVQKGQLLISGAAPLIDDPAAEAAQENEEIQEGRVKARGMVEALVWYEAFAESPLYVVQKIKTGNICRSFSLIVNNHSYHFWGKKEVPYRNYEEENIRHALVWRNLRFPVELVSNRCYELSVEVRTISPWEALQEARHQALQAVNLQLPRGGASIKKRYVNDYYFLELGTVGARVMIETLEDIAVPLNQIPLEPGRDVFS